MIIIIFSLILLLLAYFLYVQKKKVISLQQQISDLQSKISILEKQDLATEQYNDSLRQEANTVHLYASLSLEEARKTSIKDKQSQIVRSSEHILELLNNEKV
jgi:predicted Holliday junction resolvase-like endonuclease